MGPINEWGLSMSGAYQHTLPIDAACCHVDSALFKFSGAVVA
jgi:hypothetical protein